MFMKTIAAGSAVLTVLLSSAALLCQAPPAAPSSYAGIEFPVIMLQNVAAGAVPVGTKVHAKLVVATLVNGAVIPQDAILSGEVTESVAKSATNPSRLAIRMDSAQWKNRSALGVLQLTKKVYLTAWYYREEPLTILGLSDGPPDAASSPGLRNGPITFSNEAPKNAPSSRGVDTGNDKNSLPGPPLRTSSVSKRRVLMKNVELTRNGDGAVSLTSKRFNLKLDKTTTYVFAPSDLAAGPG